MHTTPINIEPVNLMNNQINILKKFAYFAAVKLLNAGVWFTRSN